MWTFPSFCAFFKCWGETKRENWNSSVMLVSITVFRCSNTVLSCFILSAVGGGSDKHAKCGWRGETEGKPWQQCHILFSVNQNKTIDSPTKLHLYSLKHKLKRLHINNMKSCVSTQCQHALKNHCYNAEIVYLITFYVFSEQDTWQNIDKSEESRSHFVTTTRHFVLICAYFCVFYFVCWCLFLKWGGGLTTVQTVHRRQGCDF